MKNDIDSPPSYEPLIPASQNLPEITLRVVIIGTLLTIILAAANAFLGLKVGQTISASIPASIISMTILRFFKNSNVLENTMVQTMASVGEALTAGVAFILPALIILHAWDHFYYWQTVIIALLGGILGVLFTIPLRRALLMDKSLPYPEGLAITNVLKASVDVKTDSRSLMTGGAVGALISLCQTGFQILTDHFVYWTKTASTVWGFGIGLSPALIAAGYIVGINVALSVFLGVVIGWLAGVPLLVHYYQITLQTQSATEIANNMWHSHIRYIGVGTMLIGGLWTIVTLFKPILQSLHASFLTIRESRRTQTDLRLRTEKDIPMNYVFWSLALLFIPLFCLVAFFLLPNTNTISSQFRLILAAFSALYILIGGFIFCSISAYFAGLIGSSNNPVSGLLVSALLILCLGILVLFHFNVGIKGNELLGVMAAIGSAVVMGSALAISNDTMQDLKVGQLIGATPWKQQVMLLLGVVASAFVIPPILELLFNAYGIGGVFPHVGMPKEQMLAAPQAGLMAAVAQGIYAHNLLWNMIYTGLAVGFVCIVVDEILKRIDLRLPVLAVGLGIYLPLDSSMPVVIGGLLTFIIQLRLNYLYKSHAPAQDLAIAPHKQRGLLLVCGIVAGSSIVGVVLAIPFALKQSSNALRIMPDQYAYLSGILSIFVTLALCAWIAKTVIKK